MLHVTGSITDSVRVAMNSRVRSFNTRWIEIDRTSNGCVDVSTHRGDPLSALGERDSEGRLYSSNRERAMLKLSLLVRFRVLCPATLEFLEELQAEPE